jgi:single-strand DNA-binding protein
MSTHAGNGASWNPKPNAMNQTNLSGYLTADIETKEIGEKHLSKFTVACNQGDKTVFLPVEAWNMEHLPDFLGKGSRVLVSGSLRQDQWESKDGGKRSRIVLSAYQVEFLDPPSAERSRADEGPSARNRPRSRRRAA